MLKRAIGWSRYLILIAVLAIFVAALLLLAYGGALTVGAIQSTLGGGADSKSAKALILSIIELVDLFLLATALYVIAAGLYELFIDEAAPLPSWLEIHLSLIHI